MKKLLTIGCAMALVVAFAMPAAAIQMGDFDFKFKGYWHTAYFLHENNRTINDDDPNPVIGNEDNASWLASRWRWWFVTTFKEGYGGTLGFEVDAGNGAGPWALGGADNDQVRVEVKHGYAWFKLPFYKPVKFTIGLQSMAWLDTLMFGGWNGDYYSIRADWAIVKGWSAHWFYGQQTSGANFMRTDDDTFFTGIKLAGKPAPWLSFNIYWLGYFVGDASGDNWDDAAAGAVNNLGLQGAFTRNTLAVIDANGNWVGFNFKLRPKPFFFNFRGNYFFGSADGGATLTRVNAYRALLGLAASPDLDFGAFGVDVTAGLDITSAIQAAVIFWWFEGNSADDWRDGDWGRWSTPDGWNAAYTEIVSGGANSWRDINRGFREFWNAAGGYWGIGGRTRIILTKKWKFFFKLAYIEWTEAFDKSTAFQNADFVKATAITALLEPNVRDEEIGVEVDARIRWQMYKYLRMDVSFSYLAAMEGLDSLHANGTVNNSDDAYKFYWIVQLAF